MPLWTDTGRLIANGEKSPDPQRAVALSSSESLLPGEALQRILLNYTDPLYAVFDPNNARWYCTEFAADFAALTATLENVGEIMRIKPDSGQAGRALTWQALDPSDLWGNFLSDFYPWITAAKPRLSVASLVNKVLKRQSGESVFLAVNQGEGVLKWFRCDPAQRESYSNALAAVQLAGAAAVTLDIVRPPTREYQGEWPAL